MSVTGIKLMVPPTVNLHNVGDLHLSLGIADSNTILNLAHRLTRLRIPRIRCFSMYRKDLDNPGCRVHFVNKDHELDIIALHARKVPMVARKSLVCLHLYPRMGIDPNGFIELVTWFPNMAEIHVNGEIAEYVDRAFNPLPVITSAIDPSTV
ncbi:hypothetical protein DL89DRAFT_295472 [Linderina pennispora]|uniref:Uncharacterized protein n=1 Tax=Linderina pennispora TaxID=61395 RepID=A0A1Y1W041_9FUNG|nr:uncharacterized protein DL89DRAFT_295472 [Linderina pennispora]ORX66626.1 hypothetical protein DL89DRAFT_295472 [Linderina pennispora]